MNQKTALLLGALSLLVLLYAAYAVDSTAPSISLTSPDNNLTIYTNKSTFSYTVADASSLLWCKLKVNDVIQDIDSTASTNKTNSFSNIFLSNGSANWFVECSDNETNVGNSSTRVLNVFYDTKAPAISLNIGSTNISEAGVVNFSYNVAENQSGLKECRLFVDDAQKDKTNTPSNSTANLFKEIQLTTGVHTWAINCTDNAGNEGASQIATLGISAITNLSIELVSPANNYAGGPTFNFTYIPKTNENLSFCGVLFNGTVNLTTTKAVPNVQNNFTGIRINDGTWEWKVTCKTLSGVNKTSSARNLIVGAYLISSYLEVILEKPSENHTDDKGIITFAYTPKSTSKVKKCELLTNNSVRTSSESVTLAKTNEFADVELSNGMWRWKVKCTNSDEKTFTTKERSIFVERTETSGPIPGRTITPLEAKIDIKELNESFLPAEFGGAPAIALVYVILLSIVFSLGVFFFAQDKYRTKIFGMAKPKKIYAKEQLKVYIDRYLRKGVSQEKIRRHLKKFNWKDEDVDKAFVEVYSELRKQKSNKRSPLRPPHSPPYRRSY